jgi:hypothetical protein
MALTLVRDQMANYSPSDKRLMEDLAYCGVVGLPYDEWLVVYVYFALIAKVEGPLPEHLTNAAIKGVSER